MSTSTRSDRDRNTVEPRSLLSSFEAAAAVSESEPTSSDAERDDMIEAALESATVDFLGLSFAFHLPCICHTSIRRTHSMIGLEYDL